MTYIVGIHVYKADFARFGLFAFPFFPGTDTYDRVSRKLVPNYDMFSVGFIYKATDEEFASFARDSSMNDKIKETTFSNGDSLEFRDDINTSRKEVKLSDDYILLQFLPEPIIQQNKDGLPAVYKEHEVIKALESSKLPAIKVNLPPLKERQ